MSKRIFFGNDCRPDAGSLYANRHHLADFRSANQRPRAHHCAGDFRARGDHSAHHGRGGQQDILRLDALFRGKYRDRTRRITDFE